MHKTDEDELKWNPTEDIEEDKKEKNFEEKQANDITQQQHKKPTQKVRAKKQLISNAQIMDNLKNDPTYTCEEPDDFKGAGGKCLISLFLFIQYI